MITKNEDGTFSCEAGDVLIGFNINSQKPPQIFAERLAAMFDGSDNSELPQNLQLGMFFVRFFNEPYMREFMMKSLHYDFNALAEKMMGEIDGRPH